MNCVLTGRVCLDEVSCGVITRLRLNLDHRYEQASSEGCSRGTYLLGHLFLKGRLSASKTRTFALLRQAALGGQTEAYCSLGACYEQGIGVEVNIPLAIESYRRSAALGSKVGMFSLGYLLVENAIEMRKQLKQMRPFLHNSDAAGSHRSLATGGGVVAHTPLDERFAYLSTEAEATLQEGIHWLRAASENHVKDAAFQLGRLYEQVCICMQQICLRSRTHITALSNRLLAYQRTPTRRWRTTSGRRTWATSRRLSSQATFCTPRRWRAVRGCSVRRRCTTTRRRLAASWRR